MRAGSRQANAWTHKRLSALLFVTVDERSLYRTITGLFSREWHLCSYSLSSILRSPSMRIIMKSPISRVFIKESGRPGKK
jgi:hypothetical protein